MVEEDGLNPAIVNCRPLAPKGDEFGLTVFFRSLSPARWLTEHQTKNPPVRRVTGANQHHGRICTLAEVTESRKNSYRE
jgi:hypothetical protein